jgi:RNA polymerase sigma-70 factor (ECF subfamily)
MRTDFHRLFQSCAQDLLRLLTRRVACPHTAADLVQDAFVKVINADTGVEMRDARSYLFRTAINLANDHGRRQRVAPVSTMPDEFLIGIADPAPSPERDAAAREEMRRLQQAIDRLSPRCREVLVLARVMGLTCAEIGARLGISPKTAFTHLTKGLAAIELDLRHQPPNQ